MRLSVEFLFDLKLNRTLNISERTYRTELSSTIDHLRIEDIFTSVIEIEPWNSSHSILARQTFVRSIRILATRTSHTFRGRLVLSVLVRGMEVVAGVTVARDWMLRRLGGRSRDARVAGTPCMVEDNMHNISTFFPITQPSSHHKNH